MMLFEDDIGIWLMDSGGFWRQDQDGVESFLQSSLKISTLKAHVIL